MVDPITINVRHLSQDVRLPQEQVQAAVDLLDAGFPVPFIARYRKEVTNNLDEETLRQIEEELRSARILCERKLTILKTIESAGKLTPELDKSIREAKSMKRLEDIYLPFRPKRHNLAVTARENGLEPFALEILEGTLPPDKMDERAAEFFNEDKKVMSIADVLLGAGHIIADVFSCNAELVHHVRDQLFQYGSLTSVKIESPNVKKNEAKSEVPQTDEKNVPELDNIAVDNTESIVEAVEPIVEETVAEEIVPEEIISDDNQTEESETKSSETEASESDSVSIDESQEVTELFEQLKEEQAEKGMPVVRSQNTLKKKKKAEAKKKLDEIKQRQREHFERQFTEYFQFSTKLRGLPTHRILALNRGEKHKIIQITLQIDEAKVLESVKEICVPNEHIHAVFLTGCLQDALHRVVLPMLIREIRSDMTEYAEKQVIRVFSKNLRSMLLQRPLSQKRVLALEPSNKNSCITVALDEFGNLLGHETIFLTNNAERKEKNVQFLAEMIRRFGLSAIAIGSGGSHATEELVSSMLNAHFADSDLAYVMMNKSGLIAYATSAAAKAEFPDEDMYLRAAVSIGRRLQNPLDELVKVEPASLGIGMFHHDVHGNYLKQMLNDVVESCVNFVGIDLNTATPQLLSHIAGLNQMTARRIYEYRREHGQFRSRDELKKVPGINETVYTYAAGFLRITGGDNPLDSTNIHPESYELAAKVLDKLGFSVNDLRSDEKVRAIAGKIAAERIGELTQRLSTELSVSLQAIRTILDTLAKQGCDLWESQPPLMFRKAMLKFENLTPGTELTGTILNVTDFGAFVDIGLHESGFIHVSQMASGYIRDAHERVAIGNMVRVWVVESDAAKKRISLTLLPSGTVKQTSPHKSDEKRHDRPPREQTPRPNRERRESSDRPREGQSHSRPPRDTGRDSREGRRFDRHHAGEKSFDRVPKTFVSAPVKKEMKPITEKMKQGKEPMRSFSDLAQLFGHTPAETEDKKQHKK